jgi:hypothetical protein
LTWTFCGEFWNDFDDCDPPNPVERVLTEEVSPTRGLGVRRPADPGGMGVSAGIRESVGSVIGTLGSVNVKGRNVAGLWPDRGGPRVQLWFTDEQMPVLRDALACRVQVSGLIRRDGNGRMTGVTVHRVERLPSRGEGRPLTGLVGLVPSLTGDRSTLDFLDDIRGQSRRKPVSGDGA